MAASDVYELLNGKHEDNQIIYQKMREKKEKQIDNFVEKHGSAPLQRSSEWFLMRSTVVGASELAALVGMSNMEALKLSQEKKEARATRHIRTHNAGGERYSKTWQ